MKLHFILFASHALRLLMMFYLTGQNKCPLPVIFDVILELPTTYYIYIQKTLVNVCGVEPQLHFTVIIIIQMHALTYFLLYIHI